MLRWALKHPFVLKPVTWLLLLATWFGVAFALVSGSVATPLPKLTTIGVMALPLVLILVALFGWHRLLRTSDLLLVFLSRFATLVAQHVPDATTHATKVRRGLEECDALVSAAELRNVGTALTRDDASRLLDASAAQAVVFGELLVAGSEMEVRAEILRQRPVADPRARPVVEGGRRTQLPREHRIFTDPGIPLVHLARGRLTAEHAVWIQQELLSILAAFPVRS